MNRIRELRLSAGITQTELAKRIGCNQTAIGKYERGELEPNISTLKTLSTIFECRIDFILCHSDDFDNVVIKYDNRADELTTDERALIADYRSLAPALQEMLRATIATWKGTSANTGANNPRRA